MAAEAKATSVVKSAESNFMMDFAVRKCWILSKMVARRVPASMIYVFSTTESTQVPREHKLCIIAFFIPMSLAQHSQLTIRVIPIDKSTFNIL